jgi:hypothetical protein
MAEPAARLVLVCPSLGQACGISEYSLRVTEAARPYFTNIDLVRETGEARLICEAAPGPVMVVLQHEYGLLDSQSRLASRETTAGAIGNLRAIGRARPDHRVAVVMHSVVFSDERAVMLNRQWFGAGLPIFSLSREGAQAAGINHLHHGVFVRETQPPVGGFRIGAFGFLSENKDVESILKLCARTRSPIHANFATPRTDRRRRVLDRAAELGVEGTLTFDFMQDAALFDFLSQASVLFMAQHDFQHYATSGSARFALSTGRPVLTPPHRPFHDLAGGVIFAEGQDAVAAVRRLKRDPAALTAAAEQSQTAAKAAEMGRVYADLANRLTTNAVWCGGSPAAPVRITSVAQARLIAALAGDAADQTPQNLAALHRKGVGLINGRFTEIAPDDHPHRPDKDAPTPSPKDIDVMPSFSLLFNRKSQALGHVLAADAADEALAELFADDMAVEAELRALRGLHPAPVRVFELLGLPLYAKALLLRDIGLTPEGVREVLAPIDDGRLRGGRSDLGEAARWIERIDRLKRQPVALDPKRLDWTQPGPLSPVDGRRVVYPSALLGMTDQAFVASLYAVFRGRAPSPGEFRVAMGELAGRLTRTELALMTSRTGEGLTQGVEFAGAVETWSRLELSALKRVDLVTAMAPRPPSQRETNLAYRDQRQLEALATAARKIKPKPVRPAP